MNVPRHRLVALLALAFAALPACSEGPTQRAFPDVDVQATFDRTGGELEAPGVSVRVPNDALSGPVEVSVRTVKQGEELPLPRRTRFASRAYALEPHGLQFEREARLEIEFAQPPEGRMLRVARLDDPADRTWEEVRGVSFEEKRAIVPLRGFSFYAVVSCAEDSDCGLGADTDQEPDASAADDAGMVATDGGTSMDGGQDAAPVVDASSEAGDAGPAPAPASLTTVSTTPFGSITVGSTSAAVRVVFMNDGDEVATGCTAPTVGDPAFALSNDTCAATDLGPGESCSVDVQASPTAEQAYVADLVRSCAAGGDAATTLSVTGVMPSLSVSPMRQSFGPVHNTTSAPFVFTFSNGGAGTASGCSAPALVDKDAAFFSIEADSCGTSDLGPSESCLVTVTMTASNDEFARRTATLERVCDVGGTVATDSGGLRGNQPHYFFLTSTAYTGDLGGITGADQKCQTHAEQMGAITENMGLTWKALLSTSSEHARDRIRWGGPVLDVRGDLATYDPTSWLATPATAWSVDGTDPGGGPGLLGADQFGNAAPDSYVWSGSDATGAREPGNRHCVDWTSGDSSDSGWAGQSDYFTFSNDWIDSFSNDCGSQWFSIMCVSDTP